MKKIPDAQCMVYTLPETNSSPQKIGLPKRKVVFQPSIFRGYVSFREGTFNPPKLPECKEIGHTLSIWGYEIISKSHHN